MEAAKVLLAIADADAAILRAEKRLEALPEKQEILSLRHKMREVEALLGKAETYVADAERLIKANEDEAALLDEKMEVEQAKILSGDVTNPKELQNLSRELDSLRRRRDKLDNQTMGFMEKLENGQAQAEKVRDALTKLAAREARLVEEFKHAGGELTGEIATLKRKRTTLLKELDAELTARYEEALATKHGVAVGALRDGVCSACRMALPAERVQALLAGPAVAICPTCHRLLVVRDGKDA
ncbi:MAG: C4-type zinc ribbon domain-containing protein [Anaerosomatales bacterium]|nr:C4-type zinc ribbon domain-containing protein [Anaerosomatales bacterium]